MEDTTPRFFESKPAFGAWLLRQKGRDGWIGDFALAAFADRSFPRTGDTEAVRQWLSKQRASGDDWQALADAENDFQCF